MHPIFDANGHPIGVVDDCHTPRLSLPPALTHILTPRSRPSLPRERASYHTDTSAVTYRGASARRALQQFSSHESGTHIPYALYGWRPTTCEPSARCRATTQEHHARGGAHPDGLHVPWLIEGDGYRNLRLVHRRATRPTLRPGPVVVLDKLSVHKAASIRQALEARGCSLLFLPPYARLHW